MENLPSGKWQEEEREWDKNKHWVSWLLHEGRNITFTYISLTKSNSMAITEFKWMGRCNITICLKEREWENWWRALMTMSKIGKEGVHSGPEIYMWKNWRPRMPCSWNCSVSKRLHPNMFPILIILSILIYNSSSSLSPIPSTGFGTKSLKQTWASKSELVMSEPKHGGPAFGSEAHVSYIGLFPIPMLN